MTNREVLQVTCSTFHIFCVLYCRPYNPCPFKINSNSAKQSKPFRWETSQQVILQHSNLRRKLCKKFSYSFKGRYRLTRLYQPKKLVRQGTYHLIGLHEFLQLTMEIKKILKCFFKFSINILKVKNNENKNIYFRLAFCCTYMQSLVPVTGIVDKQG